MKNKLLAAIILSLSVTGIIPVSAGATEEPMPQIAFHVDAEYPETYDPPTRNAAMKNLQQGDYFMSNSILPQVSKNDFPELMLQYPGNLFSATTPGVGYNPYGTNYNRPANNSWGSSLPSSNLNIPTQNSNSGNPVVQPGKEQIVITRNVYGYGTEEDALKAINPVKTLASGTYIVLEKKDKVMKVDYQLNPGFPSWVIKDDIEGIGNNPMPPATITPPVTTTPGDDIPIVTVPEITIPETPIPGNPIPNPGTQAPSTPPPSTQPAITMPPVIPEQPVITTPPAITIPEEPTPITIPQQVIEEPEYDDSEQSITVPSVEVPEE